MAIQTKFRKRSATALLRRAIYSCIENEEALLDAMRHCTDESNEQAKAEARDFLRQLRAYRDRRRLG